MQNFNIDLYTNYISTLQQQVEQLKEESEKAEIEIQTKMQKIQNLPR